MRRIRTATSSPMGYLLESLVAVLIVVTILVTVPSASGLAIVILLIAAGVYAVARYGRGPASDPG